jgi:hypothetical protein
MPVEEKPGYANANCKSPYETVSSCCHWFLSVEKTAMVKGFYGIIVSLSRRSPLSDSIQFGHTFDVIRVGKHIHGLDLYNPIVLCQHRKVSG